MVVTLERASLRKNQVQGVRGQEHGEQTPNQAEIDSKVAACWGPLGQQLGHERWWRHMQRDDTRQRRRDCSENPNWRTDRLEEEDRWTPRSQVVSHGRRQKRWTRQQLVERDIDMCRRRTKAG